MSLSPFAGGMPSDPGRSSLDVGWSIITPPPNAGWGIVQPRTSSAVRACGAYGANTRWRQLALYFRRRPEVPVKRTFSIFAGLAFSVGQTANCDRVVVVFPHPAAGGRGCPQVRGHVPHTPCGPSRTAESNEEVVSWCCLSMPSKPNPSFPLHTSDAQKDKAGKRSERFEFWGGSRNSNLSDLSPALSF